MPKEYFYCSNCQTRVSNAEFFRCFEIRGQLVCDACVPQAIAPLSMKDQEAILIQVRDAKNAPPPPPMTEQPPPRRIFTGATSARLRSVNVPLPPRPTSGTQYRPLTPSMGTPRPQLAPPRRSTPWGLVFFLGLIAALGVFSVLTHFGDPGPAQVAAPTPPPAAPVAKAPPAAPAPTAAPAPAPVAVSEGGPLAAARAYVRDHPTDLTGQQDAWRKALLATDGQPGNAEARKEFDALREIHKIALEVQLKELDAKTRDLIAKEDFKAALVELDLARKRHGLNDWAQAVDLRVRDLNAGAWKTFTPLRDRAIDAKRRKADAEIAPYRERVSKWGLESFVKEFDRALAGVTDATPPPPVPTTPDPAPANAATSAWRLAWEKAIAPAQLRDYAAARAALEKAVAGAASDVAAEAKEDLEILKTVEAVELAARRRLSSWNRGERLAVAAHNEEGRLEMIDEPFLGAADGEIELMRGGGTVVLEGADVAARSLGELYRTRPGAVEADRRAAALLCLFEGDTDGARVLLTGAPDQIPWKYWALSARLAETSTSPREAAARKLYFAAAREHVSPRTRAASISKYRTLLNDHADARIVITRRARIVARRDAAKETVFLAEDLEAGGTFKASRHPKTGPCWLSMSDSPPAKASSNFIEFSFYALPDANYRCWVYVAACCAETFTFWTQSTDLTVQDPETKSPLQAEPGGGAAMPVKHGITFLKAKHETHGGPKEPKRWEWVQVPLPKYTAGGVKSVRLLTDQKGFAAAMAVASATRSGPPLESELKTWLKSRAEDVADAPSPTTAPAPETRDPSLVGHWKLDEAGGATAHDASGGDHTGILSGDPARGQGKYGGALLFDGRDRHVTIPNSAALDRLSEGSYTIAAWYRPESRPAGAQPTANDAYHAIVMKTGVHEGLKFGADLKFAMDHWLADGTGSAAVSGATWPPGTFYHVAGVVNKMEGSVRLYVNGRLEGTNTWQPTASPRDYGRATWKIGIAAPGAAEMRWAADGAVDDVRLYNRALTQAEIKALAGGGAATSAPTIAITSPGPGETFEPGSTIGVTAAVTGLDKVARVDFLLGATVIGTDATAPWSASWTRVPAGLYTITARATIDKNSPPLISRPITIRVGEVSLYRAINLGGTEKASVEGVAYEPGSGAPNLAVNGDRTEHRELDFFPTADGGRNVLLRTALSYRDGTVVTLSRVPNGTYQVFLWVLEDDESETIDLLIEDKPVQTKYATGPKGSWAKLGPWTLDLSDGALKIGVKGGSVNVAAVELWKVVR